MVTAPGTPCLIGEVACTETLRRGTARGPQRVVLHSRTDPCGHIQRGECVPTFVEFVREIARTRPIRIAACGSCGQRLLV